MLGRKWIPNIYDETIEYQGIIYKKPQILKGANILLNALKETYPINTEPYKTAVDTLSVLVTVFAHGTIDLLKKLKKKMLHELVDVVKEFSDKHCYCIAEQQFNNEIAFLLHCFVEANNIGNLCV